jgi:hypothetical protein
MILYPFAFINTRIITELDAGNATSYPGTGTAWYDLSGYTNTGTLVNGPVFSSLGASSYFTFDGTDDAATVPSLNLQQNFTLSGWFNPNVLNGFALFGQGTTSPNLGLHVVYQSSTTVIRFGMFANDTDFTVSTPIDNWYNIVCTYNNTTYVKQLYINGVAQTGTTQQTQSAYAGSGTFRLGATYSSGGVFGNGLYAGFTVNNSVLSAAQILQDYNDLKDRYSLVTSGLVMQLDAGNSSSYPGTGTTWTDLSGYSNNGTLISSPTFTSAGTSSYFTFNGVDEFVRGATSGFFALTGNNFFADTGYAWTASTWFKFPVSPVGTRTGNASFSLLGQSGGIGGGETLTVYVNSATDSTYGTAPYYLMVGIRGAKTTISAASVNTGVWNQVVVTWNGTSGRAYLNGADRGATNIGTAAIQTGQYFDVANTGDSGAPGDSTQQFEGDIANVLVYNRALSAEEVAQNYTSLVARFV